MAEEINAIASMVERSEKAQAKFPQGTSQHTLLKNRIKALRIASSLIEHKADGFTRDDFENALAPITSLISKSEKAQAKLAKDSWQYAALEKNLKALHTALPLLKNILEDCE